MAIDENYFQGGKDAEYLKGSKTMKDLNNYLIGKFNSIQEKAYKSDDGTLKNSSTVPVDIMNTVYDFFVEKVLGLGKKAYGKLSDMGKKFVYNNFKAFYQSNKKMDELEKLFNAKDKAEFEEAKGMARQATLSMAAHGTKGPLDTLEDKLGVA